MSRPLLLIIWFDFERAALKFSVVVIEGSIQMELLTDNQQSFQKVPSETEECRRS